VGEKDADRKGKDGNGGESTLTVVLALCANIGVALLKLAAGLISGSSALLSEAAHSAGDSTTEVLLLVAQRRSRKPADRAHPFGYGKERYFWTMIAAVAIFVSGAIFSIFEGIDTVLHGTEGTKLWINFPVLGLAAVLEGISWRQAAKQMRQEIRTQRRSVRSYLHTPRDPTVNSVLLEDSAALIGLVLAALGVGLHMLTGNPVWDGAAALAIGVLLLGVSFTLARACETLLIGTQADPRLIRDIVAFLEEQAEVLDVVDVLTMLTGADSVLLCTRVDFEDKFSAADLEEACVRLDGQLRKRFPVLDEVFIQPASRRDESLRHRIERRYGHALADT
jgi:cation diffusion facilitator family transporter